jgi:hypothetical protein
MSEDEFVDPCSFGNVPDVGDVGVQGRHSFTGGAAQPLTLEVAEVCDLVHKDIGVLSEGDEVIVDGGVAGEDD